MSATPFPLPFDSYRILDDHAPMRAANGEPIEPGDEPPGLDDDVDVEALEQRLVGYTLIECPELRATGAALYDVAHRGLVVVAPHPKSAELWGVVFLPAAAEEKVAG